MQAIPVLRQLQLQLQQLLMVDPQHLLEQSKNSFTTAPPHTPRTMAMIQSEVQAVMSEVQNRSRQDFSSSCSSLSGSPDLSSSLALSALGSPGMAALTISPSSNGIPVSHFGIVGII